MAEGMQYCEFGPRSDCYAAVLDGALPVSFNPLLTAPTAKGQIDGHPGIRRQNRRAQE
jgi:hypothetical protein